MGEGWGLEIGEKQLFILYSVFLMWLHTHPFVCIQPKNDERDKKKKKNSKLPEEEQNCDLNKKTFNNGYYIPI